MTSNEGETDANEVEMSATTPPDVVEMIDSDDLSSLCQKVIDLEHRLDSARKMKSYWQNKWKAEQSKLRSDPLDTILSTIDSAFKFAQSQKKKDQLMNNLSAKLLDINNKKSTHQESDPQQQGQVAPKVKPCWGEMLSNCLLDILRKYYQRKVFSPNNILRAMDMTGGQLSLEGVEVLRKIETGNKRYARKTILPSSAEIKRAAAIVEAYAKDVVPYTSGSLPNDGGEYVEWDPAKMIPAVLKGFKLEEIAKNRRVWVNQAIDGAQLSKRITRVTYGFKVVDKAAVDPFHNRPIFANPESAVVQSWNLCFPLKIVLHRKTKEIYGAFEGMFERLKALSTIDSKLLGNLKPLEIAMNSDMSATWKGLGQGGAAKVCNMPCHCCPIESDNLAVGTRHRCTRFCQQELHQDRDNWLCYHHEFLTEANLAQMTEELKHVGDLIGSLLPELESIAMNSKLRNDEDPRAPDPSRNQESDISSIHFDVTAPGVTVAQKLAYSNHVTEDLMLRDLSLEGGLLQRQQRL